jgi:hypothetical protein
MNKPLSFALLLALFTFAVGRPARAELLHGTYEYPSPIAFDAQLGAQVDLGGYTPGGFKLELGYTHRFARYNEGRIGMWFFGDLDLVFGPSHVCFNLAHLPYDCSGAGDGSDFEVKAGVQLTFATAVPLVPFVRVGIGVGIPFLRSQCDDTGVGVPLAVIGGGARYFLTRHLALSATADLDLGPGFYNSGNGDCFTGDHNEVWRSLSILLGAQYAL